MVGDHRDWWWWFTTIAGGTGDTILIVGTGTVYEQVQKAGCVPAAVFPLPLPLLFHRIPSAGYSLNPLLIVDRPASTTVSIAVTYPFSPSAAAARHISCYITRHL